MHKIIDGLPGWFPYEALRLQSQEKLLGLPSKLNWSVVNKYIRDLY
jgi:hypothetical protein